jgi:glycosyltransferase involved in cell wall biosynthesis
MSERASSGEKPRQQSVAPVTHNRHNGALAPVPLPRVVIAHDFMETYGGAERVTEEMARAFPEAPVVAILGRRAVAARMGVEHRFRSLLPARTRLLERYRLLAPLYGEVADRARLPDADVMLSSSYAFAHRMRTGNDAPRVCYCHSPLRFAWSMTGSYRRLWAGGRLAGPAFELLAAGLRRSDRRAARQVARYLTQSPFTAAQIERFYGLPAAVIGAPVDCGRFRPSGTPPEDFFLFCGRLIEPYKRVGVAIEAFRRLGWRLVVAGDGPALEGLRRTAPPNVEFVGHVEDGTLVELMQRCRAAVFPSRDDFGLIPLEVMACGRPVLAHAGGGSMHTSVPGVTGELFEDQTVNSLEAALRAFEPEAYDPRRIREHALNWDSGRFRDRLVREVVEVAALAGR